ncbi:MAG: peptidylprolyl isomerase [Lachnospiraceae bacterium]|nr:peptidylprolyl isomerase [Lachnospiraceae bacterium]
MENNEKKMTNYDRKRLAREEAAKREKKKNIISIVSTVAIVAVIAALLIVVPMLKDREKFKEFFKVNNESVSELEFNFHRTNLINSNSTYLSYFGMTSEADLETMMYDEETGTTWAQYFTERAAESIKENKAMIADAKAKNIPLDIEDDYKEYMAEVETQAASAGMSAKAYLNALFGADEKELKDIITDNLKAVAYSEYLYEQKQVTDEAAQAEYDANKDKYDSVDYRVLDIPAMYAEDASEADIETAKAAAKKQADEMLAKVKAGEDFETLCATYATEDKRAVYADSETDTSLVTGETSYYSFSPYSKWLFDSARTEGEADIYFDEESNVYYVLLFQKRYMGENVLASIKDDLTYTAVIDYITEISASYTISDPEDNLPSL